MSHPPDDPFFDFCGFVENGSDFRTKYIMNETTMTLTACGEMVVVGLSSLPLLFFTVINMCLVTNIFPRFDRWSVYTLFTLRLGVCVCTVILLLVALTLSLASSLYELQAALLIEYSLLALVWTVYAALWIASLKASSWTRTCSLSVSNFFASKAFVLIAVNRWLLYGFYDPRTFLFLAIIFVHFCNLVGSVVEWAVRRRSNLASRLHEYMHLGGEADEGASLFSRLLFLWTNQLITKGSRKQLTTMTDVFELPSSLVVSRVEREMIENSPTYYTDGTDFSLVRSLLRTFGVSFLLLAVPRLLSDLFTFAGPILLHLLVNTLEDPNPTNESWLWASLMMFFSLLAALSSTHFNFAVQKMSLRVRAATVTSIYDKLMRVPLSQLGAQSTGRILNFVSSDVDRIVNFSNSFHSFWSLPVQFIIALFLLYREVGLAFLAGLVAAIILIPINKFIANRIGRRSELMMGCKDQRVKLITETMQGMRAVKLSAWESFFEGRIGELRSRELQHLKARKYLDAVCVYLWASAPLLITLSILASYTILLHERLTAAKVFTSLALVNILIMPLNAFPWVLNGLVEAFVSLRRLDSFFQLHNLDYSSLYSYSSNANQLLSLENASFSWSGNEGDRPTLSGISFIGEKGRIIGVTGPVGSGKSTLLLGVLGEAECRGGRVRLRQLSLDAGIAYVGQTCWLSRGTIRENILSGLPMDTARYERVLHAACLQKDLKAMPGGDSYEISENGATLSGGQRVRVTLARALYQDNSVYLLDDPFASLDRKVAEHIWREAVEKMLRESGKLVVVASHDTHLLLRADTALVLSHEGTVEAQGNPREVLPAVRQRTEGEKKEEEEEGEGEEDPLLTEYVVQQDEEKQEGAVRASVYASYGRATGAVLVAAILLAIIFMQIFKNTADWWLTRWTNGGTNGSEEGVKELLLMERKPLLFESDADRDRSIYFLTVYSIIAGANTVFTLARAFLFALGGVVAASRLHSKLLSKLLSAPLSWWDRTPAGRVINRMCADVYTVDDSLPFQLNILLASLFNLIGALTITLIGLPLLIPLIIFLFIVYYFIQRKYRKTTVELKRLSSISLSPLYSLLADSVNGLCTIRAHRFVENMCHTLRERLSLVLRSHFSSLAATSWLSMRLSAIAVSVVSCVAFAAILQHRMGFVDSGLVGLAVSYALSMTSLLNGLLGSFIETEKEMVSVERMNEYIDGLPKEEGETKEEVPSEVQGALEMHSVSVRYEPSLPFALSSVNIRIEAGQKVAIIGRTGSGKSTLFQALLRAVNLESGSILIDGVDISTLPLKPLRKIFGVVPQSPFLFSGTLAENLLVDNTRADRNALSHIVRVAHLEKLLERIGGLDGEIEEGGRNLSAGERQIVSLCRVLLQKPQMVLVDEATAHVDGVTRHRLFSLLSACLPLCTLLSIVHRPHSLADYDILIRMDAGRVVSCGPPREEDIRLIDENSDLPH